MDQVSSSRDQRPVQIFTGLSSTAGSTVVTTASLSGGPWHPVEPVLDEDWLEFSLLAAQWKRDTAVLSSRTKMTASRFYRRIIEMGEARAVPQIIRQIRLEGRKPDHWWPALRELTGADPVPQESKGDGLVAARLWIEWARPRYAVVEAK